MKNTLLWFSAGSLLFLLSPIASADCVDYGNYMHWLGGHRAVGLGQYEKDIVVVGSTAYVVSGSGLQIVDVSTPTSPVILSRVILTGGGSGAHQPTGITVVGSMAYITVALLDSSSWTFRTQPCLRSSESWIPQAWRKTLRLPETAPMLRITDPAFKSLTFPTLPRRPS
jgi:LVIVD repeat-containing protein